MSPEPTAGSAELLAAGAQAGAKAQPRALPFDGVAVATPPPEASRLARLNALIERLDAASTPHQAAVMVLTETLALFDAQGATVALQQAPDAPLEVIAALGDDAARTADGSTIGLQEPLTLARAARGGTLIVDEEATQQTSHRWPKSAGAAATRVAIPLRIRGDTLGAIGLSFRLRRDLSPTERALLTLVARQCAQTLEHSRAHDREHNALASADAANDRLSFLADASAVLDRSLDPDEALHSLASVCVPRLGDLCVIDVLETTGRPRTSATAATDQTVADSVRRLRYQYPLDPLGPHPASRVQRDGQTLLMTDLPDTTLREIAGSGEHLGFMREARYRSAIVAPLRARGRNLGSLSVLRLGASPPYEAADKQLTEELASRAAMALDNAFLYAEREADERAARFLAESGQLLAGSLDHEQTLAAVAKLAVPALADWCVVDVLRGPGDVRRMALAHTDVAELAEPRRLENGCATHPGRARAVREVLGSGVPRLHAQMDEEVLAQMAHDERHLLALRALQGCSAMIVPMRARGRVAGTIVLVSAESRRRFAQRDLNLAEELGRRAGLAVDNARLYEHTSHIAMTLQASLLPPELPEIPGLRLAARYRPTGAGNEVGGDFYDVFGLDDGSWAVVIGDVCGKGADAAAVTALARYTIRAVATSEVSPSEVLSALNQAILRQRADLRFCTAVYARITLNGDSPSVTLATAGHPRPLVRNGANVHAPGSGGTLLGVRSEIDLVDTTVSLSPGDALVLYTDGLTDAGAPSRALEEEDLLELLREAAGKDAETLADQLEGAALRCAPGGLRDDIAIVVLQVPEAAPGA